MSTKTNNPTYKLLPVKSIHVDRKPPLCKQTLDLAMKLESGKIQAKQLPPIRVTLTNKGVLSIRDGRHRLAAFKLAEITHIYSKVSKLNEY